MAATASHVPQHQIVCFEPFQVKTHCVGVQTGLLSDELDITSGSRRADYLKDSSARVSSGVLCAIIDRVLGHNHTSKLIEVFTLMRREYRSSVSTTSIAGGGLAGAVGARQGTIEAMTFFSDPVLESMATRRSVSKVGPEAPTDEELLELLAAVTPVADHKALRPWRLITLRGDDRARLGEALDAAAGTVRKPGDSNTKPLRAELLIAIVASPTDHPKVPEWEQLATAAGAGHLLELALWQAGWGVMWRTGVLANSAEVRAAHGLSEQEHLMGWLYVGSVSDSFRRRMLESNRPALDPHQFLGSMPGPARDGQH